MTRNLVGASMALSIALAAMLPLGSAGFSPVQAAEANQVDHMAQMRVTLKKLQNAMVSMKDFDELEKAGMPKASVDKMRRAMQLKINQMMEEVLQDIQKL